MSRKKSRQRFRGNNKEKKDQAPRKTGDRVINIKMATGSKTKIEITRDTIEAAEAALVTEEEEVITTAIEAEEAIISTITGVSSKISIFRRRM